MHPTIDEQLTGAKRLLGIAESESELTASSAEALSNARRLLDQVQRSWSKLLPFYLSDNDRLVALLAEAGQKSDGGSMPSPNDVAAQAGRNAALRQQLTDVIASLPMAPDDNGQRAAITDYLVSRVDSDPS